MSDLPVVAITGTSRGIGHYLAGHYLERGWRVAGCSRRVPSEELSRQASYRHQVLDVTDEKAVVRWIRDIRRTWGRLDACVNNAGQARMNHTLLTPGRTMDEVLAVNVKGTMLVSREAGKMMQRGEYGRIVNFSSVAVALDLEGESVYAASKAAVVTYSRVLARELAPANVTVNVVAPSPIRTDLIRGVPEDKLQKLLEQLAIRRFATFQDVAHAVDFFLSPESTMITGQVITFGAW